MSFFYNQEEGASNLFKSNAGKKTLPHRSRFCHRQNSVCLIGRRANYSMASSRVIEPVLRISFPRLISHLAISLHAVCTEGRHDALVASSVAAVTRGRSVASRRPSVRHLPLAAAGRCRHISPLLASALSLRSPAGTIASVAGWQAN